MSTNAQAYYQQVEQEAAASGYDSSHDEILFGARQAAEAEIAQTAEAEK